MSRTLRPEVLVGLYSPRTVEMLVGMLGILKAGGAYVPLDPSYPAERLSFMMKDSRATMLVTTADLAKIWPDTDARVVRVDTDWPTIERESTADFDSSVLPRNLAYVIYTSGSTGKPKGVMVTHSGLANYLRWAAKEYGAEARRSALVHSSISFDLTITGLFTPLLLGGRVELLIEDSGVDGLLMALRGNEHYGLIKITPAHLELLSQQLSAYQVAQKVGLFVIGGENLESEKLRFWREFSPRTRLINEYGPTETVVGCCTYEVKTSDPYVGSVPIGRPIDNTRLYVLDQELKILPPGATGELYIGGAGVARGYLNLPELTEQRFVADPFSRQPDARMYRTGDLARCRNSGIFEYLGRSDDQVKLRGYRIELGEVEATIAEHPAIRQSAAMLQTEGSGKKRLVGYAVRRENFKVSQAQLREFLRLKLPHYMVPTSIIFLDGLPLTSNGKVDRRALPAPMKGFSEEQGPFIRPRNRVESELVAIFERLFGVEDISTTDDFFDLGGDSLLIVELLIEIEKTFGKHLSVATVFEAPTISELAHVVQNERAAPSEVIPIQPVGSLPPFFCVGAGPLFRALANRLGTGRPFLGLSPRLQQPVPCTIQEIAADLAGVIHKYQNKGPYYLGGWRAWGIVAYEIAQQLTTKGHEVRLLVLFDVKNPARSLRPFAGEWYESYRQKLRFLGRELKELKLCHVHNYMREKLTNLEQRVKQSAWKMGYPVRIHMNGRVVTNGADVVLAAAGVYQPLPYGGRVAFFSAASRPGGRLWDFSQSWRDLVEGGFEAHEIPGDHLSIFLEPNVASLAKRMSLYL